MSVKEAKISFKSVMNARLRDRDQNKVIHVEVPFPAPKLFKHGNYTFRFTDYIQNVSTGEKYAEYLLELE